MSKAVHRLVEDDQPAPFRHDGDFALDPSVLAKFPPGSRVLTASRFGTSTWTVTARIRVQLSDGTEEQYFLKCAAEDAGKIMVEGEFNAMSELHAWTPDFVPKPHSWGRYQRADPVIYFFLSQFIEMHGTMPEPSQLCEKLAKLHRISTSSNGKFGLHVPTCQGRQPQLLEWQQSWTVFFSKALKYIADADFDINGRWEELAVLEQRIFSHVIPQLIGNLERGGRSVKPCLIHNDAWEGNIGTSCETGNVYVFDSGAFYAHNEMEIGNWRCHYNKIHRPVYTQTYLKKFAPCEPKEEWEDRNRMYCIYYNIIYSCNHAGQGKAVRQAAFDDMYYLIDKYAPFAEGEGPRRLVETEYATLSAERDHTTSAAGG